MMPHQWTLHAPTDTCPARFWHCPGCLGIHDQGDPPPVDPCPGRPPHTAEDAALCVRAFEVLGTPLPTDFWERAGALELLAILDAGAEAG